MDEQLNINTTHEQAILNAIENYPIFSFSDVFVYFKGCSRATAYNHNLDKLDSIKEAIYHNKRQGVTTMLSKWIISDNATLQIAAFKQICDDEERQKLNQQNIDHTSKGESLNIINLGEGKIENPNK
jgi:ketol-acid reductoisomerase